MTNNNATLKLNDELKGIEIYFDNKPLQQTIDTLKNNGFRWSGFKKCWYTKQSEKAFKVAETVINSNITSLPNNSEETTAPKTTNKPSNKTSKVENVSLFDRVQFKPGNADTSKYKYRFVGSNYTGLSTKDTAAVIRKHLKSQFPEVKFSVTSDYNRLDITIKSSPYLYSKLAYSPELTTRDYRDHEAENNKEINTIKEYCQSLLDSYNYDDSDSMTDYFHCHYYDRLYIDSDYTQTEQTAAIKADIADFRNKLTEVEKAEEERKEKEYQEREAQRQLEQIEYKKRQEEEERQKELINNSVKIVPLEENKQYFVIGSEFAKLNKNNTLAEYQEEVEKGEYNLENVKIVKEVHFNSLETLEYFSNMLLHDFDFLAGEGGSYTDDYRIQSMTDFYNLEKEERETIQWNLLGIAIYYNNKLQYIANPEGYSYARYVGLVENASIKKNDPVIQLVNKEEIEELKFKALTLEDISTDVITNNNLINTWDSESWNEYKELMKQEFKKHNFRLTKSIIQQLEEDSEKLKIAMYKLLIEVDGIQEQFKNADLQQGQKITMFYISDFGGIVTQRVTLDSVEPTNYAQHNNAVKITFTPQGKRSKYYNYQYSTLLVYNGWLTLPEDVLYTIETKGSFITKKTKYTSCDKKQYDEILEYFEAQGIKPVINTYKPTF